MDRDGRLGAATVAPGWIAAGNACALSPNKRLSAEHPPIRGGGPPSREAMGRPRPCRIAWPLRSVPCRTDGRGAAAACHARVMPIDENAVFLRAAAQDTIAGSVAEDQCDPRKRGDLEGRRDRGDDQQPNGCGAGDRGIDARRRIRVSGSGRAGTDHTTRTTGTFAPRGGSSDALGSQTSSMRYE